MNRKITTTIILSAILLTGCKKIEEAPADESIGADHNVHKVSGDRNEAQQAYDKANVKMHAGMSHVDPDPDIAFMQGMVPHHQGAVDMAEIVLKYGKDPETRALAKTIIESQTKEIAQMNTWLEKRGVKASDPSVVDHKAMGH